MKRSTPFHIVKCVLHFTVLPATLHCSPVEVIFAAQKMPPVHSNGLEIVLVLVLEMLHFLHVHSNLHPGQVFVWGSKITFGIRNKIIVSPLR